MRVQCLSNLQCQTRAKEMLMIIDNENEINFVHLFELTAVLFLC